MMRWACGGSRGVMVATSLRVDAAIACGHPRVRKEHSLEERCGVGRDRQAETAQEGDMRMGTRIGIFCAIVNVVSALTGAVCAHTRAVCAHARAVCAHARAVCAHARAVCAHTQAVCAPTRAECAYAGTGGAHTQATQSRQGCACVPATADHALTPPRLNTRPGLDAGRQRPGAAVAMGALVGCSWGVFVGCSCGVFVPSRLLRS